MSLTYLSGNQDYLGLTEIVSTRRARPMSARAAAYKARLEAIKARRAERKARRAAEVAAYKVQQANEMTKQAAVSMDEIGRRKGGQNRAEAREERRQAKAAQKQAATERKQARQAIRRAKIEAAQARKASIKAQRATARAARAAKRQEARAQRRAAVPAPIRRRGRGDLPTPEIEEVDAEFIEDEAEQEPGEEAEEEPETEEAIEGFLGMDEIGRRKKDKSGKKAARKAKRKQRKEKRGGSIAKKITLAPVRLALFAMMKVNALKIRTKLRQAWKKDRNAVNTKLVKRFGFKLDNFLKELNRKENEKLSGAEFGVAIETAIATATPALVAIAALLKQLGINPESIAKVRGKGGTDTGAGDDTGEDSGTEVPGTQEGTPGSNFRLSTPLLLGGAALAAFLIFRKK